MAFEIKTFRVTFMWQGKQLREEVQAWAEHEAIRLIGQRYPGASSFFVNPA